MRLAVIAALIGSAAAAPAGATLFERTLRLRQLERVRDAARDAGLAPPADQFFNQTADHFNVLYPTSLPRGTAYWPQRFWTSEAVYKGGDTLFLYVEGEGAGSPYDVLSGQHVELAATHDALVLALEHREGSLPCVWGAQRSSDTTHSAHCPLP